MTDETGPPCYWSLVKQQTAAGQQCKFISSKGRLARESDEEQQGGHRHKELYSDCLFQRMPYCKSNFVRRLPRGHQSGFFSVSR